YDNYINGGVGKYVLEPAEYDSGSALQDLITPQSGKAGGNLMVVATGGDININGYVNTSGGGGAGGRHTGGDQSQSEIGPYAGGKAGDVTISTPGSITITGAVLAAGGGGGGNGLLYSFTQRN